MSLVPQKWNAESSKMKGARIAIALLALFVCVTVLVARSCRHLGSPASQATPAPTQPIASRTDAPIATASARAASARAARLLAALQTTPVSLQLAVWRVDAPGDAARPGVAEPLPVASSTTPPPVHDSRSSKNDAASRAAFMQVYRVLTSPRCQNCHPAGDAPLQGDDSHPHAQNVQRGPDGQGLYGMKCHTCHQDANLPGPNMPPGHPRWFLPGPEMKMVFVGRSPGQLCRQIKDPAQNGNRTLAQLLDHVANDSLVGWAWNPGDGRTLPPLSRPETVAAMKQWIAAGAACPQ